MNKKLAWEGLNIQVEKGETLYAYRNRYTGEFLYGSSLRQEKRYQDGKIYVEVFPRPYTPTMRRYQWILQESLDNFGMKRNDKEETARVHKR